MATHSFLKDFHDNYERPQVDGLIVGFSGIDPQRKSSASDTTSSGLSEQQIAVVRQIIQNELGLIDFDPCECDLSNLSDEQKAIVQKIIDTRLEELTLNYDGGEIDGDNSEHKPQHEPLPAHDSEPLHVNAGDINHEMLGGLMGGDNNGHLHLTDFQLKKLIILIDTFFPDGSDEVIIKPVAPVNPDEQDKPLEPQDDTDPYGGLPSGTPPDWQINMLPSDYSCYEGCQNMYYGKHYSSNGSDVLLVPLNYKNSSTAFAIVQSDNLSTWNNLVASVGTSNFGTAVTDYLYEANSKYFYFLYGASPIAFRYKGTASSGVIYAGQGYWNSVCYSPLLQLVLAASSKGEAVLASGKTKKATSYTHLTVNPACAAWHNTTAVFCLTGLEGTATSYDGENWTLHSDAPHNMRELSYREDLDSFVAWSGEDKTFYASLDGINWTQLSDTTIPLDNISTVHYNPINGWYCAVGFNEPYAYFSKDLKHWIPTKIRNNSSVDVGDVIYMSSTGLYVAMPTSGNYYYTFNPSQWTD